MAASGCWETVRVIIACGDVFGCRFVSGAHSGMGVVWNSSGVYFGAKDALLSGFVA